MLWPRVSLPACQSRFTRVRAASEYKLSRSPTKVVGSSCITPIAGLPNSDNVNDSVSVWLTLAHPAKASVAQQADTANNLAIVFIKFDPKTTQAMTSANADDEQSLYLKPQSTNSFAWSCNHAGIRSKIRPAAFFKIRDIARTYCQLSFDKCEDCHKNRYQNALVLTVDQAFTIRSLVLTIRSLSLKPAFLWRASSNLLKKEQFLR